MAITIDATGVQIEGQAEILAARAVALKDPAVLGPQAVLTSATALGRMAGVDSEREAAIQDAILQMTLNMDPATAEGYHLDVLCRLAGVEREEATSAESTSGLITTTGATTVTAASIVRNLRTQADWIIVANVVAGGAGNYAATIRSRETGVQDFLTGDTWSIVTPAANWSAFAASADLDPEDAGTDRELDPALRLRRKAALLSEGNDFDAIIGAVQQVVGVSYTGGLNNTSTGTVDGVPGGAIEVVVEGGDSVAVAQAIYDHLPPGTQTFGTDFEPIVTALGTTLDVYFTRPIDIEVYLQATLSTTGTEYTATPDIVALVAATLLTEANETMAAPGVDVVPRSLEQVLWVVTRDARTGRPTLSSILVEQSLDGVTWSSGPLAIDHKHRADYDSTRIDVEGILES